MSAPAKVVHVVDSLATGGLENGVVNIVNNGDPLFRHVIVCLTEEGAFRGRVRSDVDVFTIGKRPGQDLPAVLRLVRLLRRIRPAVVHSRNWAALDAIPAARVAGVGIVVHGEHGREAGDPEGRSPRRNRIRRLLNPLVSGFVTVSRDLERWLVQDVGLPARKVTTIRNGVDLGRFGVDQRVGVRQALGLPAEALVVGTVGRLDPVKDQAALVRAVAALRPVHPNVCLLVAGAGACREDLGQLSRALAVADCVRFLGDRRDIPQVLSAMDLFVLPSIAEGLSNTVLEAMASGLPIVATRVGGNPELIDDGVNGMLVARQDPAALTGAVGRYLDDQHLRALHGKASRQRAVDHFGLEQMSDAYAKLYATLLGGRSERR